MCWPEETIGSWVDLVEIAERLVNDGKDLLTYLCRGQSDADWDLKPSLARLLHGLTHTKAHEVEKQAMGDFKAQAHFHLPSSWLPEERPPPIYLYEWWALMQHYSAPTRLLDWTYSLYAAAYFAVSNRWCCDGAIYIVRGDGIAETTNSGLNYHDFYSDPPKQQLIRLSPPRPTDRFAVQQGAFTISLDVLADHGALVHRDLFSERSGSQPEITYQKFRLPARLKPEFMLHLRYMNIAAHSLFPDADGLGRSIAEMIRLSQREPLSAQPL